MASSEPSFENRIAAAQEETPDIDPDAAMAQLFVDKAETARMRLLMRYLGAAERAFAKAGADLAKAQAERRKRVAEEAEMEAMAAVYGPVGFVSYDAGSANQYPSMPGFAFAATAGSTHSASPS